jgi:hypothetical protein
MLPLSVGDEVFLAHVPKADWFRPDQLPKECFRGDWRCRRLAASGALRTRQVGTIPSEIRTEYQRI